MDKYYLIPYSLQFFAEGAEKTEQATPKKLSDARKEGQVARSKELTTSIELIALFLALKVFIGYIRDRLMENFYSTYSNMDKMLDGDFTTSMGSSLINGSMIRIIITCLPILAIAVGVSFLINLLQVKWEPTGKPLTPKFNKLNPISGFKKIFSTEKLITLVVEVLKIIVIIYIAYDTLKDEWGTLLILYDINLFQAIALLGDLVINLGLKISMFFLIIGVADYIYQRFNFSKDMRMTKQEVKDEYKQTEGDPKVKQKIRSRMMQASQRRMMQQLPEADVVITNPTHLAAAIKYDKDFADAPILIAKGADHLANKIKEVAKEHEIEIVENKPLARMLYYNVEIGAQIPPELYQMTAEILAYVYKLKGKL